VIQIESGALVVIGLAIGFGLTNGLDEDFTFGFESVLSWLWLWFCRSFWFRSWPRSLLTTFLRGNY